MADGLKLLGFHGPLGVRGMVCPHPGSFRLDEGLDQRGHDAALPMGSRRRLGGLSRGCPGYSLGYIGKVGELPKAGRPRDVTEHMCIFAPLAQLDRASVYGTEG